MAFSNIQTIPILRIFDEAKAKEFYVDYLGFTVDWEHRYGENFPLYMQVSRGGLVLHLSEHYGDSNPGSAVYIRAAGLVELHQELQVKDYKYLKPGLCREENSVELNLLDPFGNKLRLNEDGKSEGKD
ncbi:MAG: VOC family protein [Acidobacteriota bacterium]|nr:VOC family protein [Acidobacteriota bacterium]